MRLALTDLRRGIVILSVEDADPPAVFDIPAPTLVAAAPYGVALLPDGRLITADRAGHRLIAVGLDGTDVEALGNEGAGAQQFLSPAGVAVGPDGAIFVADSGNHRVVAMDSIAGDGWRSYGAKAGPGTEDFGIGRFARLTGIAVDGAGLVVTDAGAARVVRLSSLDDAGWEASLPGVLRTPVAVTLPPGGGMAVADLSAPAVIMLDTLAKGVAITLADAQLPGPTAVAAIGDARLAILTVPNNALVIADRINDAWSVGRVYPLDGLAIRRPTSICLLP